jgi:release factor glutamine methyltransferase
MFSPWQTAAQVTRDTLSAHGLQADVVVTDLVHGLEKRLAGSVDVLLFNPPYVPTPEHEVCWSMIFILHIYCISM